ncbi:unnamed protein product [Acanthoscelides obtectus]|nr:unnamed protein product [Acanthoscelides obtectus]CAK1657756.1 hypothetical protein AOBTE_LOCUS20519 [Acanthoscelides obtectus]
MVNVSLLNILHRRSDGLRLGELKGREYQGVQFVTIKAREPQDPVLKYLLFILKGIQHAITRGYLKEIFLLFKHHETLETLEVYSIALKYNTEAKQKDDCTFSNLRDATMGVLKCIEKLEKLDKLEKDTRIKFELTYNDLTPFQYQPPGFKHTENPLCLDFDKKDRLVFGQLNTGYHKIYYSVQRKSKKHNLEQIFEEDEEDEIENTPLLKRLKMPETGQGASQSAPNDNPEQNADTGLEEPAIIIDSINISADSELEQPQIIDENKNCINQSPLTILNISLISSEDSVSVAEAPILCSNEADYCICEVASGTFIKSGIDGATIEKIVCHRCKRTYHMPCHGYLSPSMCFREFICVKCSPYNTTDTIIRSIEGNMLRTMARCRLMLYLMFKYEKFQEKLMSMFSDDEQHILIEKFLKYNVINLKKQVDVMQIQRSANLTFNMEDSQFLY